MVEPHWTLLEILRDELSLTGAKEGCGEGVCGSCTVLMDGKPIRSCLTLALEASGCNITTVEGLASGEDLDRLQRAFVEKLIDSIPARDLAELHTNKWIPFFQELKQYVP